jgi:hypothetical protein
MWCVQWALRAFSPELKRLGRVADSSSPCNAEVKNGLNGIVIIKDRSIFTFLCGVCELLCWICIHVFGRSNPFVLRSPNLGLHRIYIQTSLTFLQSSFEMTAAGAVGKYRNLCYFHQILSRW